VAAFGALVTGGDGRIVPGMHRAAWLSSALLATAAVVVWFGIRRQVARPDDSTSSETHL
jgi:DHA2 family methylenomycin A resistance protein-like MFS transporter